MKAVGGILREHLGEIADRLKAMERRLQEVEGKQIEYRGTYRSEKTYQKGSFVSHASCLWHADEETEDMPGRSNSWTLVAKAPK